jgi:hypothetical protein
MTCCLSGGIAGEKMMSFALKSSIQRRLQSRLAPKGHDADAVCPAAWRTGDPAVGTPERFILSATAGRSGDDRTYTAALPHCCARGRAEQLAGRKSTGVCFQRRHLEARREAALNVHRPQGLNLYGPYGRLPGRIYGEWTSELRFFVQELLVGRLKGSPLWPIPCRPSPQAL